MASRRAPPPVSAPTLDTRTGYEALNRQFVSGQRILAAGAPDAEYSQWSTETRHWVEQSFGENSAKANEFVSVAFPGFVMTAGSDTSQFVRDGISAQLRVLGAFVNVLKQTLDIEATKAAKPQGHALTSSASNRVFVVHGHDSGTKETVARFLGTLGLVPVILHEQPNQGRTIIEKFEAYADVAFAVVLLTPDDRGGTSATLYEGQKPRARQNVILELGYFLGRLGRAHVCALYEEGTEIPSDFQGVLFVPLDSRGAWRLGLARELKQVIASVDLNKAM